MKWTSFYLLCFSLYYRNVHSEYDTKSWIERIIILGVKKQPTHATSMLNSKSLLNQERAVKYPEDMLLFFPIEMFSTAIGTWSVPPLI